MRRIFLVSIIFLMIPVTIWAGINQWTQINENLVPGIIVSLAVNPKDSNLFAGCWPGGAYLSRDHGTSWKHIPQIMPEVSNTAISSVVPNILIHPQNSDVIYIGTLSGGWRSEDAGETWKEILDQMIYALAFDPQYANVIYAGTLEGVFKSIDGGNNWKQSSEGLKTENGVLPYIHAIVIDPKNSDNLYAIASQRTRFNWFVYIDKPPKTPPDKASFWGLFKSTDGGNHWYRVGAGIPDRTETYIPVDANYLWGDFAIDVSNPAIIYFTSSKFLFRSKDGGINFENITPELDVKEGFSGIDKLLAVGKDSSQILMYGSSHHIYQSKNTGQSWTFLQ